MDGNVAPSRADGNAHALKLPARGVPVVYFSDGELVLHPAWDDVFNIDEKREVIARSLYRLAHPWRNDDEGTTIDRINRYWRERAECRIPIQERPPGARLCWHPKECVYADHAERFAWRGSGCLPKWMELLVTEIAEQNPNARVCRVTLETGRLPDEDANDLYSMVLLAKRFSRAEGFQWSDWLRRKTGILPRDRSKYHIEARVRLSSQMPRQQKGVMYIHEGQRPINKARCAHDAFSETPAQQGFLVAFDLFYVGPPLDHETLERRWRKYPANRGRAGVAVTFEEFSPLEKVARRSGVRFVWRDALDSVQRYLVPALALDADGRVDLTAMTAQERLRRVFRLGRGQGLKKVAVKAWKESAKMASLVMLTALDLSTDGVEKMNLKERAEFNQAQQRVHYELYPQFLSDHWREATMSKPGKADTFTEELREIVRSELRVQTVELTAAIREERDARLLELLEQKFGIQESERVQ